MQPTPPGPGPDASVDVHGRDETMGRVVAVKRLLTSSAGDDEARTRFIREAQIQGQLEHPAIVPVYDLFLHEQRLRGRTLEDILIGLREKRREDVAASSRHRLLTAFTAVCIAIAFRAYARRPAPVFSSSAFCRQSDWLIRTGREHGNPVLPSEQRTLIPCRKEETAGSRGSHFCKKVVVLGAAVNHRESA